MAGSHQASADDKTATDGKHRYATSVLVLFFDPQLPPGDCGVSGEFRQLPAQLLLECEEPRLLARRVKI